MKAMKVERCRAIELQFVDDGVDGNLVIAENLKQIPFEIKRVYFINNLSRKTAVRGKHAHKGLEQAIFCISGSFELELDDGINKEKIILDRPHSGICMGSHVWHTMHKFSRDCVILVLASDLYKESDYIRNYAKFIEHTKNV